MKTIIGKNIKAIRLAKGWSRPTFCSRLGMRPKALESNEAGRSSPRIEKLKEIADYFGITIDDLLTENFEYDEEKVLVMQKGKGSKK